MTLCGCGGCGLIFTSLSAFDQHQTTDYGTAAPVTCHDPAARGLILNADGRWSWPPPDASSRPWRRNLRASQASGVPQ
jgi:hypothetical protein